MVAVSIQALQIIVGIAMLGVAGFSLFHKPADPKKMSFASAMAWTR